ncbi:hypothetical protein WCX18_10960 [Sulfurimonas sp. HSL1-2]|uniref:hypothetical protein n=1 Tax=Thiomicrolovo zhangzhouensis TaxID=3131933 RepID=UPI0031F9401A
MKPFKLPAINQLYGSVTIETKEQLFEILSYQNPLMLKEYKKHLPWYVKVSEHGAKLKINVFQPIVVVEKMYEKSKNGGIKKRRGS